jgi:hypothetical protein
MNPATAGQLSRSIASVIPLFAEPAGDWISSASDSEIASFAKLIPKNASVAWFSVLSHEVLPYQGIFLDPKSGQGWTEPRRIRGWLRSGSHSALSTGRTDDHVITLLEYACWLLNRCRSQASEAHLIRLRELLDDHLLRWIPALSVSLTLHDLIEPSPATSFYSGVGRLLLERLCTVRRSLGAVRVELEEKAEEILQPLHIDLLTPAISGIWFSRRVLAGLCRELGHVPCGEREAVCKQLLDSSDSHALFGRELGQARQLYDELSSAYPESQIACRQWAARAVTMRTRLV